MFTCWLRNIGFYLQNQKSNAYILCPKQSNYNSFTEKKYAHALLYETSLSLNAKF